MKSERIEIIEVSQFFEVGNKTYDELKGVKDQPVLLSEDKKACLWTENANVKMVGPNDEPHIGGVWFKRGKNGMPEIHKAHYDSSD